MSKRVAIVQSSYIPWKGFFDMMRRVDELILYDDAQFTRRDWRSRNRIKTREGLLWLSIPVGVKGKYLESIKEMRITDRAWADRHFKAIESSYARAPHFPAYRSALEDLYRGATSERLSEINRRFLEGLAQMLGITTPLSWSMDYSLAEGRVERLVSMCKQAGASRYVSGPSAKDYMDPQAHLFAEAGIEVAYMDYSGYPEYAQPHPPFEHHVSVIDLLLCTGPSACAYLLPADVPVARREE